MTKFQQNILGDYGNIVYFLKTVFLSKIFVISVNCNCVASDFSDTLIYFQWLISLKKNTQRNWKQCKHCFQKNDFFP